MLCPRRLSRPGLCGANSAACLSSSAAREDASSHSSLRSRAFLRMFSSRSSAALRSEFALRRASAALSRRCWAFCSSGSVLKYCPASCRSGLPAADCCRDRAASSSWAACAASCSRALARCRKPPSDRPQPRSVPTAWLSDWLALPRSSISVELRCCRKASPAAPCQTAELSLRSRFISSFACCIDVAAVEMCCCSDATLSGEPGQGSKPRFGYVVVAPMKCSSYQTCRRTSGTCRRTSGTCRRTSGTCRIGAARPAGRASPRRPRAPCRSACRATR
jgi:hypothetical protein